MRSSPRSEYLTFPLCACLLPPASHFGSFQTCLNNPQSLSEPIFPLSPSVFPLHSLTSADSYVCCAYFSVLTHLTTTAGYSSRIFCHLTSSYRGWRGGILVPSFLRRMGLLLTPLVSYHSLNLYLNTLKDGKIAINVISGKGELFFRWSPDRRLSKLSSLQ